MNGPEWMGPEYMGPAIWSLVRHGRVNRTDETGAYVCFETAVFTGLLDSGTLRDVKLIATAAWFLLLRCAQLLSGPAAAAFGTGVHHHAFAGEMFHFLRTFPYADEDTNVVVDAQADERLD